MLPSRICCVILCFVNHDSVPRKATDTDFVTFSVRMPTELRRRLEAMAIERDMEVSQLIRHACVALVNYYDFHGGVLHIPVNFDEIWQRVQRVVERNPSGEHLSNGLPLEQ